MREDDCEAYVSYKYKRRRKEERGDHPLRENIQILFNPGLAQLAIELSLFMW